MTREELLKMSKKDLKNRLAELGKNAQTLSGQELTDAMDEARTIGEILDEIKGRKNWWPPQRQQEPKTRTRETEQEREAKSRRTRREQRGARP